MKKHHRRSIRLNGYDYSQAGGYFVTICTQNRECLLGEITNGKMVLNCAGKMVIITTNNPVNTTNNPVGADLRVCPNTTNNHNANNPNMGEHNANNPNMGERNMGEHDANNPNMGERNANNPNMGEHDVGEHGKGEHIGSPLRRIVQWFKTMVTNEYIRGVKSLNWQRFDKRLWQRNYYEHIIRNENEYNRIAQYICNNPIKWGNDKLNNITDNTVMESHSEYGTEPWMI